MTTVPCQYKTGKVLGQGTYATVREAVHIKTGKYYAVKVIQKALMVGREHMIRNEIQVLKKISEGHKNIVTMWDYFETQNNLYLVTDLCLGGELFDRICSKQYFRENDAAQLIETVVGAVAYLHDHGIVHRDLKPENLLFRSKDEDSEVLIADFGLSKVIDDQTFSALTTTCGTPGYMAPEIFQKRGHGKPVDMWAVGVITYFLLCGYTPFDRDNQVEEIQAICSADYAFEPEEYWREVSQVARDFIKRCLTIDPTKRITAHRALNDPWLVAARENAAKQTAGELNADLLPAIKQQFDPRSTFRRAIFTVRATGILAADGRRHQQRQKTLMPQDEAFYNEVQRGKSDAEMESENVTSVLAQ